MIQQTVLALPVIGEISEVVWDQGVEGQPLLLLHDGRPAAVIVDLESWEDAELAAASESE